MLHHSKFVNTKSYQKASPKRGPLHFPSFSRAAKPPKTESYENEQDILENNTEPADSVQASCDAGFQTNSELEPDLIESPKADKKQTVEVRKIHASVNFDEMQRLEELNKVDGDWAAFFLGVEKAKEPVLSESTELVRHESFGAEPSPYFDVIMTPPPVVTVSKPVVTVPKPEPTAPSVQSGPACLDEIFNELIAEDKVFKRSL